MDKTQIILAFLGSAVIGAVVSALVTELGKWRERKSRREELVLSEAMKLAQKNMDVALEVARAHSNQRGTTIVPLIEMAALYHRYLDHLMRHGRLPADYVPAEDQVKRESSSR